MKVSKFEVLGLVVTILGLVVAILAWLWPISPISNAPLANPPWPEAKTAHATAHSPEGVEADGGFQPNPSDPSSSPSNAPPALQAKPLGDVLIGVDIEQVFEFVPIDSGTEISVAFFWLDLEDSWYVPILLIKNDGPICRIRDIRLSGGKKGPDDVSFDMPFGSISYANLGSGTSDPIVVPVGGEAIIKAEGMAVMNENRGLHDNFFRLFRTVVLQEEALSVLEFSVDSKRHSLAGVNWRVVTIQEIEGLSNR